MRGVATMVRLAVNEMTTLRWSFEEDVHNYLAAGFDGIGIWRQKFDDFGEEAGIDFLAESGIDVSSLMWVGFDSPLPAPRSAWFLGPTWRPCFRAATPWAPSRPRREPTLSIAMEGKH